MVLYINFDYCFTCVFPFMWTLRFITDHVLKNIEQVKDKTVKYETENNEIANILDAITPSYPPLVLMLNSKNDSNLKAVGKI